MFLSHIFNASFSLYIILVVPRLIVFLFPFFITFSSICLFMISCILFLIPLVPLFSLVSQLYLVMLFSCYLFSFVFSLILLFIYVSVSSCCHTPVFSLCLFSLSLSCCPSVRLLSDAQFPVSFHSFLPPPSSLIPCSSCIVLIFPFLLNLPVSLPFSYCITSMLSSIFFLVFLQLFYFSHALITLPLFISFP